MKNIIINFPVKLLGNDKLLRITFVLLRAWFIVWLVISVISIFLGMFLILKYDLQKVEKVFLPSVIILVKSTLYLMIIMYWQKCSDFLVERKSSLQKIAFCFFILFCIDGLMLFLGSRTDSVQDFSQFLLEVIPRESTFYLMYSKIYLYVPLLFNFIKPEFEGVSLLILSVFFAYFSQRTEE